MSPTVHATSVPFKPLLQHRSAASGPVASLRRLCRPFDGLAERRVVEVNVTVDVLYVTLADGTTGPMAEQSRKSAPETLLTSDKMAARTGLKTRRSVHDWLKMGRIVGWRGARRGHVLPPGQLNVRSRLVDSLDRVEGCSMTAMRLGLAHDGTVLARWATPLTLLAGGDIDRVLKVAEGGRRGNLA